MPLAFRKQRRATTYVVRLCDGGERRFELKHSMQGRVLMATLCASLKLREERYFGLRYTDTHNLTRWLLLNKSLHRQLGDSSVVLHFNVRYYTLNPDCLEEETARYYFFAQLRQDVKLGRCPLSFGVLAEVCAYAVQAELGDYDPLIHKKNYVSKFRFVQNQTGHQERKIAENHIKLKGGTPAEMECCYLQRLKGFHCYGLHLHPCMLSGSLETSIDIGASARGVYIFSGSIQIGSFPWKRVRQLKYKKRQLTVEVTDTVRDDGLFFLLEVKTERECRLLWNHLIEQHYFFKREMASWSHTGKNSLRRSLPVVQDVKHPVQRTPMAVDRTPSNKFVQRYSTTDLFKPLALPDSKSDYSLDDQRHPESLLSPSRSVDATDNRSGIMCIGEVSDSATPTNHGNKGSSSTLPNPALHSQLLSSKANAALDRRRSLGFSSLGWRDKTLSLQEYQRKASEQNWHRSRHQQQLEKLLNEYERSMSHGECNIEDLESEDTSTSNHSFFQLGKKTGRQPQVRGTKSAPVNTSTPIPSSEALHSNKSILRIKQESKENLKLQAQDNMFTEANGFSSNLPDGVTLDHRTDDLSTRCISPPISEDSTEHSDSQDLSFDDFIGDDNWTNHSINSNL